MKHLLLFAAINLVTSALSGAAGGGGALVTTPVLVLLGLPPATAIANGKFSGLGISAGTSARFFREKITDKRLVLSFSILSAVGAMTGTTLLVVLSAHEELLQHIMAYTILLVGIPLLYVRNIGLEARQRSKLARSIGYFLLIFSVMFQAALSSGLGALQLVVLMGCFGMTAITASATRRAMQLTVACISLTICILGQIVNYKYGITALVTALIGGYIGAHIAVKKGNKFVVNLFALTSALLALELLWR